MRRRASDESLRRKQAAVAIASLVELAPPAMDQVTPFEKLDVEEQEWAKNVAANLISLADSLLGEV